MGALGTFYESHTCVLSLPFTHSINQSLIHSWYHMSTTPCCYGQCNIHVMSWILPLNPFFFFHIHLMVSVIQYPLLNGVLFLENIDQGCWGDMVFCAFTFPHLIDGRQIRTISSSTPLNHFHVPCVLPFWHTSSWCQRRSLSCSRYSRADPSVCAECF